MDIPKILQNETKAFTSFIDSLPQGRSDSYELVEARWDSLKFLTQSLEQSGTYSAEELKEFQEWFRFETDPWIRQSPMAVRARNWPEGYPGDYRTLEGVYRNTPSGKGVGIHIDRYFLSRTLAVAVRSRCRHLSELLTIRSAEEPPGAKWLNLACGPCRELLSISSSANGRCIYCVDSDTNALDYAKDLLADASLGKFHFLEGNAYRFANAKRNIDRFGLFSTIYSAGLFDYIPSKQLSTLLSGLYESLAPGGIFIAPFKDKTRYETFDYHWFVKWHYFFQRDESEFRAVFAKAGISYDAIRVERDDSGVLLFFIIRK